MSGKARPHIMVDGVEHKACGTCRKAGRPYVLTLDKFSPDATRVDGLRGACKSCEAGFSSDRYNATTEGRDKKVRTVTEHQRKNAAKHDAAAAETIRRAEARAAEQQAARDARLGSDFDPLRPDDFDDLSVGNTKSKRDRQESGHASRDKRAEYSRNMGRYHGSVERAAGKRAQGDQTPIADMLPREDGEYIGGLAEQQRRFGKRRVARSLSLFAAAERDAIEQSIAAMKQYLSGRVRPTGYATRPQPKKPSGRTVCCLLSDLHIGSDLSGRDEPMAFGPVEEARRLEHVLRQFCDYKTQYRDKSNALLILNGDLIEGLLMHDLRSGAPLVEQKMAFQSLMGDFLGHVAARFPGVHVVCQPGNHGRDLVRHPGRATARKWDGHEVEMFHGLRMQCRDLKNVTWQIDFRAVSIVDLHGSKLGVTHGDTEIKLGHPDKAAAANASAFEAINSNRIHGVEFDAWVIGHFHTPRFHPRRPKILYNGALVPPNGHARGAGYIGEPTGQFIFEATEGFPIGDLRFVEVGQAQDRDESLGKLVRPFRFDIG